MKYVTHLVIAAVLLTGCSEKETKEEATHLNKDQQERVEELNDLQATFKEMETAELNKLVPPKMDDYGIVTHDKLLQYMMEPKSISEIEKYELTYTGQHNFSKKSEKESQVILQTLETLESQLKKDFNVKDFKEMEMVFESSKTTSKQGETKENIYYDIHTKAVFSHGKIIKTYNITSDAVYNMVVSELQVKNIMFKPANS